MQSRKAKISETRNTVTDPRRAKKHRRPDRDLGKHWGKASRNRRCLHRDVKDAEDYLREVRADRASPFRAPSACQVAGIF